VTLDVAGPDLRRFLAIESAVPVWDPTREPGATLFDPEAEAMRSERRPSTSACSYPEYGRVAVHRRV